MSPSLFPIPSSYFSISCQTQVVAVLPQVHEFILCFDEGPGRLAKMSQLLYNCLSQPVSQAPSQPLFHPSLLVDNSPPPSLCLPFWMANTFQSIQAPGPKPLINSRAIYVVHASQFFTTPGAALGF